MRLQNKIMQIVMNDGKLVLRIAEIEQAYLHKNGERTGRVRTKPAMRVKHIHSNVWECVSW